MSLASWRIAAACAALWASLGFAAGSAWAQAPAEPQARAARADGGATALRERANAGVVGLVSGGVEGTYIRIAADLAAVLDGPDLRVLPIVGKGSVQNVQDVMYLRGVDVGIVQSDVLAYLRRERATAGVARSLQYIAKLYNEELHLLARRDTARLEDLAGKKVNVDVKGGGTFITASLVFEKLGIAIEPTHYDQALALEKLRAGEIAALAYVAGRPTRLFRDIRDEEGLHFVPVAASDALLDTYLPAVLSSADYPGLIAEGQTVETVAVGAVMAVYAWPQGHDRHRKVARFVDAFFSRFPEFLKPPRHAKWKEVNLAAKVPGWTRFPAAENWLAAASSGDEEAQRQQFTRFLSEAAPDAAGLSPQQREALFAQFLEWRKAAAAQAR